MKYINNETQEEVTAYRISNVIMLETNCAIWLQDASKTIGLFPEQTISYIPQIDDFYIEKNSILESLISPHDDFLNTHTEA